MDAEGAGFSFPTSDYQKGQDASDVSWADIFLDGIHSDDPGTSEATGASTDKSSISAGVQTGTQVVQQPQSGVLGAHLQIHIPTHLQGTLTSNGIQQAGANLSGRVAYLTPAVSSQQQVATGGRIQNVVTVAGQHQVAASVGQQQQQQGGAKLVQIASSFPMTSVQQLTNSVPLQTLLPNQTITGQTIYGSQGGSLFPAQGSVHIENPKVVNVNFGPHVIGSDGSGQQAIIQTAEGKSVLITNSQLQHLPQSISLSQPLVGAQLFTSAGGNLIRANMSPATHTLMQSAGTGTQQIVLPSRQTVIPRQAGTTQGGITKNVVLRPLNSSMSPLIYQSGQGGSIIHSQPTLITSSGAGLQVVNTGRSQGGQVQLITQPSISQTGIGHQQLMNLLSSQGLISNTGNQIAGLMPGQNIVINGQVLNISQLGGLSVPQLQMQHNPQSGVTLAAHFQPTAQQVIIQHNNQQQQQQHTLQQPRSTQSPSVLANINPSPRPNSGLTGSKYMLTPTSNINSCSSTPTPSTPTPTPTPDIMSDSYDTGGKTNQSINILEQALALSAIDLQSLGDDINFLETMDCFPSVPTPPASVTPLPPVSKPKPPAARTKSKSSKSKPKVIQPVVNVTVNKSSVQQQPATQFHNALGQKVTISPQQKIITANGQVFVLSANGQQFILQPSPSSAAVAVSAVKSEATAASTKSITTTTADVKISLDSQLQMKDLNQQRVVQSGLGSNVDRLFKLSPSTKLISLQPRCMPVTSVAQSDKIYIKASPGSTGQLKLETGAQSVAASPVTLTTVTTVHNSPSLVQTSSDFSGMLSFQETSQKITTLGSTFLKEEPLEQVKEEPVTDLEHCVSRASDGMPGINLFHTSLATTSSTVVAMSAPLVISSASFTAMTTTQSHQTTIMSTAQMKASRQTSVSSASSHLSSSLVLDDRPLSQADTVCQSPVTPTFLQIVTSIAASGGSVPTANSKSNSKERDPANIKSMIPIKIADSTVMLSLTPGEKERFENQLSRMSKKDQEEFLIHQQNIIRRSQQVQLKQLEQQKKLIQQLQQKAQQQHSQQAEEIQQLERGEQARLTPKLQHVQLQQQSQQMQLQSSQAPAGQQQVFLQQTNPPGISASAHSINSEPSSSSSQSQAGQASREFPTTVQELLEQSEEPDSQQSSQQFSILRPPEQQFIDQTTLPVLQHRQQQMQQQVHQNLPQSAANIHSFIIPQLGRCLAEQQLLRDRSLAISPDVNTQFKSLADAMRRLVRYHTLQDHKPEEGSKTMQIWDTRYAKLCDYLVKKKRCYMQRFHKAQLYHDLCPNKQPEHIQNLKCFNEQLRELIASEKERAKNQPELFEPIKTENSPFHQSSSVATVKTIVENIDHDKNETIDSSEDCKPDVATLAYYGHKEPYTEDSSGSEKDSPYVSPPASRVSCPQTFVVTPPCASKITSPPASRVSSPQTFVVTPPCASKMTSPQASRVSCTQTFVVTSPRASKITSPPRQKRKLPESGSSGTLKLVLKRRTTDNFMVKTSSANMYELPEDLKPDVHLEKSDSENEDDSPTADTAYKQLTVLKRRTLSVSLRRTSSEADGDHSSCSSQADNIRENSSLEENSDDVDENNDEDDEVSDDEDEIENSSDDDENVKQFIRNKKCSSEKYCVSGRDNLQSNKLNNDSACNISTDAFMENDEILESVEALNHYVDAVEFTGGSLARPSEENGASLDSPHSGKNSSASMTSEDVFHSSLSYSHVDSPHAKDSLNYSVYSGGKKVGHPAEALQTSSVGVARLFGQRCRTSPCMRDEEEYVSESSLSSIKKETSSKVPLNSSLFITPNKNLLKTDAMFNSDEDDDDDDELNGDRRSVSTFKIDNKDPQSNMINDSVRSAINSVLDGDDDDDDDEDDISSKALQNNWASSANRLPLSSSSSSIHNLFHSSLSSSSGQNHDVDLDAAVQSILNS